jgi:hypothetical protein
LVVWNKLHNFVAKLKIMNHNPHNLSIGEWVILDKKEPPVKIFRMTEGKMFSEVGNHESPIDTWEVMTCRLSPKNNTITQ